MTSPNDLHAALVRRYGEKAVSEKLDATDCEWDADDEGEYHLYQYGFMERFQCTQAVALAVLESVAEGMIARRKVDYLGATMMVEFIPGVKGHVERPDGDDIWRVWVGNDHYDAATKAAALIAACASKGVENA